MTAPTAWDAAQLFQMAADALRAQAKEQEVGPFRRGEGDSFAKGEDPESEWWCRECATWNWNTKEHCRACRTVNPRLEVAT